MSVPVPSVSFSAAADGGLNRVGVGFRWVLTGRFGGDLWVIMLSLKPKRLASQTGDGEPVRSPNQSNYRRVGGCSGGRVGGSLLLYNSVQIHE